MTENKEEVSKKGDRKERGSFSFTIDNPKILKAIVETLSSFIDECEFTITPEELIVKAMDPSRICILKLTLKKITFDEFDCSNTSKIGLNLDDLNKILKRSSAKDTITIKYNEVEEKIKIQMKAEDNKRARSFSLMLLDLDIEEIPLESLENLDYPSRWKMDPDFLVEATKDAEIYSDRLNMKSDEEFGLIFNAIGHIGELDYQIDLENLSEPDFNGVNTGVYSIDFLKRALKLSTITQNLEIFLRTDHPLRMQFLLLEGGIADIYQAPRVEKPDFDDDNIDDF